jgi:hypothetical protein
MDFPVHRRPIGLVGQAVPFNEAGDTVEKKTHGPHRFGVKNAEFGLTRQAIYPTIPRRDGAIHTLRISSGHALHL